MALATLMSITQNSIKTKAVVLALAINNFSPPLKRILRIYYQVYLKKDQAKLQALLDFSSKINIITLVYIAKLGLTI